MIGPIYNQGTSYDTYAPSVAIEQPNAAEKASQSGTVGGQQETVPMSAGTKDSASETKAEKRASGECETCKNRKYQDASNENVSFKAATHISPAAAGAAVRAHEGEHVANAYSKAAKDGGRVIQASVTIHTAVCPECGRTYVSGGTTRTRIAYGQQPDQYEGNNVDLGT